MRGYDIAIRMCRVKSVASHKTKDPLTPRVKFLMDFLDENSIPFELDIFTHMHRPCANIYIRFEGRTSETVVYVAHHDIVNPDSDNLNDNTASVCNLLDLALRLRGRRLERTVVMALTDGEEIGGQGAHRLGDLIGRGRFGNVLYAINLELTGWGDRIWTNDFGTPLSKLMKGYGATVTYCPFNDSEILREYKIDSLCIGTVLESDLMPDGKGVDMCNPTWSVCHRKRDVVVNANASDMETFVDFLQDFAPDRKSLVRRIAEKLMPFVTKNQSPAYIDL